LRERDKGRGGFIIEELQMKQKNLQRVSWLVIFAYVSVSGCAGTNTCSNQETLKNAFCPYSIRNQGFDIADNKTDTSIQICEPSTMKARTFVVGKQDGEMRVKRIYDDRVSPELAYGEDVISVMENAFGTRIWIEKR
jgi:hypothetical protein